MFVNNSSVKVFSDIVTEWGLDASDIKIILGGNIDAKECGAILDKHAANFSPMEIARLNSILDISEHLERIFSSKIDSIRWLKTPNSHSFFDDRQPMKYLLGESINNFLAVLEFLSELGKRIVINTIVVKDDYQLPVYEFDSTVYVRLSDLPVTVHDEFLKWPHWVSGPGPIPLCEQLGECIYPKDFIKFSGGRYSEQEAPFDIVMGEPIYLSHNDDKY